MRMPPQPGTVFGPPVLEQFVDDRIEELLWRIPGLLKVVVDLRRVDGGDRGVGVRVGGEERALRRRSQRPRFREELHAFELRHALIGEDHRDRLRAVAFVPQHVEAFGAALGANHPEIAAILGDEVSSDRAQYLRIVIDGEDKRFDHEVVVDDSARALAAAGCERGVWRRVVE